MDRLRDWYQKQTGILLDMDQAKAVTSSLRSKLRVCGSCEWIFKKTHSSGCPRCGFGSYAARHVYGNAAYRYAKTQKPWIEKRLRYLEFRTHQESKENPCCYRSTHTRGWHHEDDCPKRVICY